MNKVITINLNGVAYQLEEGGFDALRAYLDNAGRRLEGNPDKDEIITDIEQAIADKFRALLGPHKTVVNTKEVGEVIAEMGPVEGDAKDDSTPGAAGAGPESAAKGATGGSESAGPEGWAPRRLYKIRDGAMLAGVCNGVAAYLNLDVTIVRLAFALLTFLWGAGVLVYVAMAIIVPEARTPAEKAAASGMAATAQEFIKRARDGYYEGMRSFHDKQARRAWKRKFRQEMRGWKRGYQQQQADYWKSWSHNWTQNWQQNWSQNWTQSQPGPSVFGAVFIAPLLSILLFALLLATIYVIYSLVTAHAVFGLALPASVPLWVGIMGVVLAYLLVAWPLKAMRWACYYPGPCGRPDGGFGGIFGLALLVLGIWLADRAVPEFHQWLSQLPGLLHHLIDVVQGWLAKHA